MARVVAVFLVVFAVLATSQTLPSPTTGAVPSNDPPTLYFGMSGAFNSTTWAPGKTFLHGISIAFSEANNETVLCAGKPYQVQVAYLDDLYNVVAAAANARSLIGSYPSMVAFVGFTGSPTTAAALEVSQSSRMPMVGSLTGSAVFRKKFEQYAINIRAGYDDEALVMLRFLISERKFKRISIVYQNDAFGEPAKHQLVEAMDNIGMKPAGLHSYDLLTISQEDFPARAREVWASKPQAVILFTVEGWSNPFLHAISRVLPHNITFVSGSWIGEAHREFYESHDTFLDPTCYFQTQVVPHPHGHTTIAERYRNAYQTWGGRPRAGLENETTLGHLCLEGYIVGRLTVDILRQAKAPTKEAFLEAVYTTKLFAIEDLLAGPFSRDCVHDPRDAEGRSSLCECSQGLRYVATTTLTVSADSSYLVWTEAAANVTYPMKECYATQSLVQKPVVFVAVVREDQPSANSAMAAVRRGAAALGASFPVRLETQYVSANGNITPAAEAAALVTRLGNDHLIMAVAAAMPVDKQQGEGGYPVIPLFAAPACTAVANDFDRMTMHVFATMQQQLSALAHRLSETGATAATLLFARALVTPRFDPARITRLSLESYGVKLAFATEFQGAGLPEALRTLSMSSSKTNHIIVLGLGSAYDMKAVLDALEADPGLVICVPFDEVAVHWNAIESPENVTKRLMAATNLPLWNSANASKLSASYKRVALLNKSEPLVFAGYVLARFAQFAVVRSDGQATPENFVASVYRSSVIAIDDFTLGPFIDVSCVDDRDCLCNIGPRSARVYSVADMISTNAGPAATERRFSKCQVVYKTPVVPEVDYVRTIVPAVVVPVVVIVLLLIFLRMFTLRRKVAYAPKDASRKFCAMFVGLKDEAALWEHWPSAMPEVTERYTEIVGRLARRHKCYEAMTIFGCVLIVSKDAGSAVRCAAAIATELANVDWGAILHKKLQGGAGAGFVGEPRPKGAELNDESEPSFQHPFTLGGSGMYPLCEFGISLHWDMGRIAYDAATQTFHYSGACVDGAAHVADVCSGGQVLLTDTVDRVSFDDARFIEIATVEVAKRRATLFQFNVPGLPERLFAMPLGLVGSEGLAAALGQAEVETPRVENTFRVRVTTVVYLTCLEVGTGDADALASAVSPVLDLVLSAALRHSGVAETMEPGSVLVSFNAHSVCQGHEDKAARFVMAIRDRIPSAYYIAGDTSSCCVGIVGAHGRSAQVIAGEAVDLVRRLPGLMRAHLTTHVLFTDRCASRMRVTRLTAVDCIAPEWLQSSRTRSLLVYTFECAGDPAASVVDQAVKLLAHGSLEEAEGVIRAALALEECQRDMRLLRLLGTCRDLAVWATAGVLVPYARPEQSSWGRSGLLRNPRGPPLPTAAGGAGGTAAPAPSVVVAPGAGLYPVPVSRRPLYVQPPSNPTAGNSDVANMDANASGLGVSQHSPLAALVAFPPGGNCSPCESRVLASGQVPLLMNSVGTILEVTRFGDSGLQPPWGTRSILSSCPSGVTGGQPLVSGTTELPRVSTSEVVITAPEALMQPPVTQTAPATPVLSPATTATSDSDDPTATTVATLFGGTRPRPRRADGEARAAALSLDDAAPPVDCTVTLLDLCALSPKDADEMLLLMQRCTQLPVHPNVASVRSVARDGGSVRVLTERVPGVSLRAVLAAHRALPEALALRCASGVLRGLRHLHLHRITHGALCPANVVVTAQGRVVLTAFGPVASGARVAAASAADAAGGGDSNSFANSNSDGSEGAKKNTGNGALGASRPTAWYQAPEVVRGQVPGPAADVWAWSMLVVALLTNGGGNERSVDTGMGLSPDLPPGIGSGPLRALLFACQQREPEARPCVDALSASTVFSEADGVALASLAAGVAAAHHDA